MKILVTSGGTKIPIDRVRSITNMSQGTFGAKIATELLKMRHNVIFFKADGSKSPMSMNINIMDRKWDKIEQWHNDMMVLRDNYSEYSFKTFDDYAENLKSIILTANPDVIILAAAVSDYGVANYVDGKIRSKDDFQIVLKALPKLIGHIKEWSPSSKLVGFKLLVDSTYDMLIDASKKSIIDNKCDMVVANDLRDIKNDDHRVHLVFPDKNPITFLNDKTDSNFLAKMVAKYSTNL